MKTGLVLGAGGSFGWLWHLGVLRAIHEDLGVDIHDAAAVVGTSAGALIGVARSASSDVDEILEVISQPPSPEMRAEIDRLRSELKSVRRWFRPMAPRLILDPGPTAGVRAFVGLLPAGPFPTSPLRRVMAPETWPQNLIITAVRLSDGDRVAFTADDGVELLAAMEASGSVPAMFQPRMIEGAGHIDGAVASANNADLLLGRGLDRVIISTPMTRPGRGPVRLRSRYQLRREVDELEATGAAVCVIEPTADIVELGLGYPRSNREVGPQVVDRAQELASEALRRL